MTTEPSYLKLLDKGDLLKKVREAQKHIPRCNLCPHKCGVNRKEEVGICRANHRAIVSSHGPHFGEEKVLVGSRGSGTIFFGYCNLSCVYCQNYEISFYGKGEIVAIQKLADMMLSLQNNYACHNINLVTPTHFVPNILEAIYLAAKKGLTLPIVYNTGGYECVDTLKILEGVVDIYMPDFKYLHASSGKRYSKVSDYLERAKAALKEMDSQVGGLKTDNRGIAYQGLLIRHLMLPGGLEETKRILEFIKEELSSDVEIFRNNAYKEYDTSMTTSELRSTSEQLFEYHLEERNDIEWFYKNGDTGKQYLSIIYGTNISKEYLFYPDYIIKKKNNDVWIIETKGGEVQGKSKNIDKQIANKFIAFKEYAETHKINWGFVRDRNNRLYINNAEYTEEMNNEYWVKLEDKF